jgi:hypothetical protein
MHAMKSGFRAHYKPGPGGSSLLLILGKGTIKKMEFHQLNIEKF